MISLKTSGIYQQEYPLGSQSWVIQKTKRETIAKTQPTERFYMIWEAILLLGLSSFAPSFLFLHMSLCLTIRSMQIKCLSIHSQSPGFEVKMMSIPSSKDKEISSLFLLTWKSDPAIQYPISSYEIGDQGILIEHYNFDYPGQREWFSTSSFGHIPQLRKS